MPCPALAEVKKRPAVSAEIRSSAMAGPFRAAGLERVRWRQKLRMLLLTRAAAPGMKASVVG
jgi:hypothetical protein